MVHETVAGFKITSSRHAIVWFVKTTCGYRRSIAGIRGEPELEAVEQWFRRVPFANFVG